MNATLPGMEVEVAVDDTDVELTPPDVFRPVLKALRRSEFDFDPCSNSWALVPATVRTMPPDDGLTLAWPNRGTGWLNPPYSKPGPWLERTSRWATDMDEDCGDRMMVGLLKLDPTTSWWSEYIDSAAAGLILLADRVRHIKPGREVDHVAPFPQALIVWSNIPGRAGDLLYKLTRASMGRTVLL